LEQHTSTAEEGALAREPGLKDTADDIECARLDDPAPDKLAAVDTDVDNALECEREMQGGILVE